MNYFFDVAVPTFFEAGTTNRNVAINNSEFEVQHMEESYSIAPSMLNFLDDNIMSRPLSEPRELPDDERVPDRMLRVLPPEHAGAGAIHDFINELQHSDDWFSSTLYSDRVYELFPPAFCRFLDEFTAIMGGSAKPFTVRYKRDPDSIERLLERDDIRNKLYNLYERMKEFYYRTNVYAMRCITLDVLELIGNLIDLPLDI